MSCHVVTFAKDLGEVMSCRVATFARSLETCDMNICLFFRDIYVHPKLERVVRGRYTWHDSLLTGRKRRM